MKLDSSTKVMLFSRQRVSSSGSVLNAASGPRKVPVPPNSTVKPLPDWLKLLTHQGVAYPRPPFRWGLRSCRHRGRSRSSRSYRFARLPGAVAPVQGSQISKSAPTTSPEAIQRRIEFVITVIDTVGQLVENEVQVIGRVEGIEGKGQSARFITGPFVPGGPTLAERAGKSGAGNIPDFIRVITGTGDLFYRKGRFIAKDDTGIAIAGRIGDFVIVVDAKLEAALIAVAAPT